MAVQSRDAGLRDSSFGWRCAPPQELAPCATLRSCGLPRLPRACPSAGLDEQWANSSDAAYGCQRLYGRLDVHITNHHFDVCQRHPDDGATLAARAKRSRRSRHDTILRPSSREPSSRTSDAPGRRPTARPLRLTIRLRAHTREGRDPIRPSPKPHAACAGPRDAWPRSERPSRKRLSIPQPDIRHPDEHPVNVEEIP